MKPELLEFVVCPACRTHPLQREAFRADESGLPLDGVVWCTGCRRWYPLEGGLLELLVESLAYHDDRARFWREHGDRLLALGLEQTPPDTATVDRAQEIRDQQEHSDWYADNTRQTYSEYEKLPFWRALDAITFARWKQALRPNACLLDIGCAQGRSTFQIADPELDVIAFDISKALVSEAFARAAGSSRVTFLVADATSMPFLDESFDFALTYGVLHHLPDPPGVCRSIARVMKTGGIFFASENNRSLLRAVFELLQRIRPLWYEEAGEFAQMSQAQLRTWLVDAGFSPTLRTSVFIPPHALNRVSQPVGERVLAWTDRIGNGVPGLRRNGGLVVAEAVKSPAWK